MISDYRRPRPTLEASQVRLKCDEVEHFSDHMSLPIYSVLKILFSSTGLFFTLTKQEVLNNFINKASI